MKVLTLMVGKEHVNGILHSPDISINPKIMVVFLHGWAGYRTGPHDLFVKLARALSNEGFYSLRFDFRGRGYSYGDKKNTSHLSMLADLDAALDYAKKETNIQHIVLLGICSGAKLALYYAKNGKRKIDHVIELSSPLLIYNNQENTLHLSQTKSNITNYAQKLFQKTTWIKVCSGDIHLGKIMNNITKPIRRISLTPSFLYKKNKKQTITQSTTSFQSFKGQVLLIHGEKDPETSVAIPQIEALLIRFRIRFEKHIIAGANHSFYSIKWEQEIIEIVTDWLNKQYSSIRITKDIEA